MGISKLSCLEFEVEVNKRLQVIAIIIGWLYISGQFFNFAPTLTSTFILHKLALKFAHCSC